VKQSFGGNLASAHDLHRSTFDVDRADRIFDRCAASQRFSAVRTSPRSSRALREPGDHSKITASSAALVQDLAHPPLHHPTRWSPHAAAGKLTLTMSGNSEVRDQVQD
jgi:hypothetical protein